VRDVVAHVISYDELSARALLHWVIPGQRRSVAWMLRSDGQCEVVEGVAEPVVSRDVGGDLLVAAAQVLHERVTGGQDSR
jgi:hypothetical protein